MKSYVMSQNTVKGNGGNALKCWCKLCMLCIYPYIQHTHSIHTAYTQHTHSIRTAYNVYVLYQFYQMASAISRTSMPYTGPSCKAVNEATEMG